MTKKLAVTVAIDVDAPAVTLKPAGVLTDDNVKGLVAVVRRAERVMPDFRPRLDPDRLKAASPQALRILAEAGVEITADASWAAMTSSRGPKQTHNVAA
jgi:hypothetical protein